MEKILSMIYPLAEGSVVTLQLFAVTLLLSLPLGLLLALARISKIKPLSKRLNYITGSCAAVL
jgi:polar amino acid transport system permease protein